MASTIDGVKVTRKQFMHATGISTAVRLRLSQLEQKAALEKQKRVKAEQRCAGYKAAIVRLQAIVARYKAREAAVKARTFDAEFEERPAP
jgi:hypothetical protein